MSFSQFPPSYQQTQAQAPQQQMYGQYPQQPQYAQGPQGWAPQNQPPMNGGWAPQGFPPQQAYGYQSPPPQQYQYQPDQKFQPSPPQAPQEYQNPQAQQTPQAPQHQYSEQFQQFQQQQPQQVVFRWTSPSSSALNNTVRDPSGREVFSIQTPKKKETIISSASGQVLAKLEWNSTPTISLRGGKEIKIKDWIPFDKKTDCRALHYQGDSYRLAEQNGSILIFKNTSPSHIAILSDPNDMINLELYPEALPLLDEFVIIATILQSGHNIEKSSGWFDSKSFQMGMIGGLGGAMMASS